MAAVPVSMQKQICLAKKWCYLVRARKIYLLTFFSLHVWVTVTRKKAEYRNSCSHCLNQVLMLQSICMLKPRPFLIQNCKCVVIVTSDVLLGYWYNNRIQKVFDIQSLKLIFAQGESRVALAKLETLRYRRLAKL